MTSNQIAYWQYKEQARHNKATEAIEQQRADAYTGGYLMNDTTKANASMLSAQASWLSATTSAAYAGAHASAALTSAAASWQNAMTTAEYADIYASAAQLQAESSWHSSEASYGNYTINDYLKDSQKWANYAHAVSGATQAVDNLFGAFGDFAGKFFNSALTPEAMTK